MRQKYTDSAFNFEAKLRPTLNSMNDCSNPQAPNTTIPHILPYILVKDRTINDVLGIYPFEREPFKIIKCPLSTTPSRPIADAEFHAGDELRNAVGNQHSGLRLLGTICSPGRGQEFCEQSIALSEKCTQHHAGHQPARHAAGGGFPVSFTHCRNYGGTKQ